jgi:hypothetical protein
MNSRSVADWQNENAIKIDGDINRYLSHHREQAASIELSGLFRFQTRWFVLALAQLRRVGVT